jgi:hypothetical protein
MYFVWFIKKSNLSKLYELDYYKNNLSNLLQNWVKVIYFFYDNIGINVTKEKIKTIDSLWFKIIWYTNIEDIIKELKQLDWYCFINTFEESQIEMVSKLKLAVWQKSTINHEIFLNKFIQRNVIWSKYPETITKYDVIKDIEDIHNINLEYPIIVKPIWWVQSSWTSKVYNIEQMEKDINNIYDNVLSKLEKKWLNKQEIILEEYIDWKMYSIDYFIDENQNIIKTSAIKVWLGVDYWVDDFSNIVFILSNKAQKEVDDDKLDKFIKKTVDAWKFINTFMHHEFKINSKWKYKTIETNWRIWWYRLEMYQQWNNINLLSYPFLENKEIDIKIKNNIATFLIYPKKTSIFLWYNESLFDDIKNLKSFFRLNEWNTKIWEKIWLTRDGFSTLWTIVIKNKSDKQFEQDLEFINKNYFHIIKTK